MKLYRETPSLTAISHIFCKSQVYPQGAGQIRYPALIVVCVPVAVDGAVDLLKARQNGFLIQVLKYVRPGLPIYFLRVFGEACERLFCYKA